MSDITPAEYYTLTVFTTDPPVPHMHGPNGPPAWIAADPRTLPVSQVTGDDLATVITHRTVHLLTLTPLGDVTSVSGGRVTCRDGWRFVSRTDDISPVAGPQYAAIREVIMTARRSRPPYGAASRVAVSSDGGLRAWAGALTAAFAALEAVGADGDWWARTDLAVLVALAARDLISADGPYRQEHYDLLTRPWAAVAGRPAHPADVYRPNGRPSSRV